MNKVKGEKRCDLKGDKNESFERVWWWARKIIYARIEEGENEGMTDWRKRKKIGFIISWKEKKENTMELTNFGNERNIKRERKV